jgi:hypothetical protein
MVQIERNYAADFEALNKKSSDLQINIDEIARKVDDLQSSYIEVNSKPRLSLSASSEIIMDRNYFDQHCFNYPILFGIVKMKF